jgi:hypothetical protein
MPDDANKNTPSSTRRIGRANSEHSAPDRHPAAPTDSLTPQLLPGGAFTILREFVPRMVYVAGVVLIAMAISWMLL